MNTTWIEELKKIIDDPRTGLKNSSDTNKTRYAIFALFEDALLSQKKSLIERVEGMKKPKQQIPTGCPDNMLGCLVFHFKEIEPPENKVLNDIINLIKE